jgi:DHA1 family inner membrane transport protein
VLIAQTLRFAGHDSRLASSLATAAFNLGTAGGSALAATTLSSALGVAGPAVLGAAITASALIPVVLLATMVTRSSSFDHAPASRHDAPVRALTGVS